MKVTLTIAPDKVLDVSEISYQNLKSQGYINSVITEEAPTEKASETKEADTSVENKEKENDK